MFLGKARGKVGDVVFYVRNGKQITRAKAASVKNPKTDLQMFQRAVSATILKAYQQGKEIFDHSFEGKTVPNGSMNEFKKLNMNYLRQQLIIDYNKRFDEQTDESELRNYAVSPSADTMCPNAYIISRGTYKNAPVSISSSDGSTTVELPSYNEGESVAQYLQRNNLLEGDIITVCMVASEIEDYSRVSSPVSHFNFLRLITKAPTSSVITNSTKMSDLFTFNYRGLDYDEVAGFADGEVGDAFDVSTADVDGYRCSAIGVICSRDDSKVRSNSQMQVVGVHTDLVNDNWSVTAFSMVESWRTESFGMQSPLILEGGGF